jgi:hypothetical protein
MYRQVSLRQQLSVTTGRIKTALAEASSRVAPDGFPFSYVTGSRYVYRADVQWEGSGFQASGRQLRHDVDGGDSGPNGHAR